MIPLLISNMASGNVSIQFGLRGKNINVVTACATGTHSIGEAYRTIQCSDADVMVQVERKQLSHQQALVVLRH